MLPVASSDVRGEVGFIDADAGVDPKRDGIGDGGNAPVGTPSCIVALVGNGGNPSVVRSTNTGASEPSPRSPENVLVIVNGPTGGMLELTTFLVNAKIWPLVPTPVDAEARVVVTARWRTRFGSSNTSAAAVLGEAFGAIK